MQRDDYTALDGLAMAAMLDNKQTTSAELMAGAIEQAKIWGPALNALRYERYEESQALAASWQPTGVFRGIPFLLKDSSMASKRFPSSFGSKLFTDISAGYNGTAVDRFEAAGLIPFARTTVSELCMGPSTEALNNQGPTLNPRHASLSVGGSSGGAAAAVAARIVPIAHGSDGGGSIRIPAACCGVYGLKPSRGRVPIGPARGEGWGGMASDGVLSMTVRDTAAAMDAISGYEAGAPYAAPPKDGSYLDAIKTGFAKPLKIGIWRAGWNGIGIVPECLEALEKTAQLCRDLGHEVVDIALADIDYDAYVRAHGTVLATNIVLSVDARAKALGRAWRDDDLEEVIRDGYEVGKTLGAGQYVDAINRFHATGRAIEQSMAGVDLILTPTLTTLPARKGELALQGKFWDFRFKVARYATFLAVINGSGQPAASLPLHWTAAGIPVATQLIGHFGREDQILALSAQLEQAAPWAQRAPVMPA